MSKFSSILVIFYAGSNDKLVFKLSHLIIDIDHYTLCLTTIALCVQLMAVLDLKSEHVMLMISIAR